MRKPAAALLLILLAGVLGASAVVAAAASTINVGDNYFVRQTGVPTVSANQGQRVTFKFVGRKDHRIVATGAGKFTSKTMSSGSYKTPKLKLGTYKIVCSIHGAADQQAKLKVK